MLAPYMDRHEIIAALDSEIQRLQEVRSAITRSGSTRVGRPQPAIRPAAALKRKGISEAGRKRIAEAQRKRWAAQKPAKRVETRKEARQSGKNTVKNTSVAITKLPPKQPRERTRIQRSAAIANALSSRTGTVAVPAKREEAA
jgi:hypothetical protein